MLQLGLGHLPLFQPQCPVLQLLLQGQYPVARGICSETPPSTCPPQTALPPLALATPIFPETMALSSGTLAPISPPRTNIARAKLGKAPLNVPLYPIQLKLPKRSALCGSCELG